MRCVHTTTAKVENAVIAAVLAFQWVRDGISNCTFRQMVAYYLNSVTRPLNCGRSVYFKLGLGQYTQTRRNFSGTQMLLPGMMQ